MSKPDFDKLATEIASFLSAPFISPQRAHEWLSAKIGQVYHQGAIDALDSASAAVNEAFDKHRGPT